MLFEIPEIFLSLSNVPQTTHYGTKAVWESKIVVFILLGIGWSGYTVFRKKTCFYRNIAKGKKGPRVECLIKMKIKTH